MPEPTRLLSADDVRRALTRIAHEICEHHSGVSNLVLIGIQTRGVPLAESISEAIAGIEHEKVFVGSLDIGLYRDDLASRPTPRLGRTLMPVDLNGRNVVLVDDVLFTGRTIRAALNALNDYGRPRAVQLATMVDRGHRELPIRPDYVGKNLPTRRDEVVDVHPDGVDLGEVVR